MNTVQDCFRTLVGTLTSPKDKQNATTITESGAIAQYRSPVPGEAREITYVVIDTSGSMDEPFGSVTKLDAAVRAVTTHIVEKSKIDPLDSVGIVTFTNDATIVSEPIPVGERRRDLVRLIQALEADGGTDLDAPLRLIVQLIAAIHDAIVRIILLTDGMGGHPLRTAERLQGQGVVIDVIGIGESPNDVNERLLRKLASVVNGELRYTFIQDQASLLTHYTTIAAKTRVQP